MYNVVTTMPDCYLLAMTKLENARDVEASDQTGLEAKILALASKPLASVSNFWPLPRTLIAFSYGTWCR